MKKIIKTAFSFVFALLLAFSFMSKVSAVDTDEGQILIPVEKKWASDVIDSDKKEVTFTLYKYIGTYSETNRIQVGNPIRLNSSNNFKGQFDISDEAIFDNNNNAYSFKIIETPIDGFSEIEHQDPGVTFIPPIVGESWGTYKPCNEINISSEGKYKSLVIVKKGSDYILWTVEALSDAEREIVRPLAETMSGNVGTLTFISGINTQYIKDGNVKFTIYEDKIVFKNKSDWSFFGYGKYYKSSTETNAAYITNDYKTKDIVVTKEWYDHNNILGLRPNSIVVKLLRNNEEIDRVTITPDASGNWTHTFTGLKEYIGTTKAVYTVEEVGVPAIYTPTYGTNSVGLLITNTHEVTPTTVEVTKNWLHVPKEYSGDKPGIVVALYYKESSKEDIDENWTEISRATLNKNNNWHYVFENTNELDILPSEWDYKVDEVGYEEGLTSEQIAFFNDYFVIKKSITKDESKTNAWIITNDCIITYELPKTGSSGMLIIAITEFFIGGFVIYTLYELCKNRKLS